MSNYNKSARSAFITLTAAVVAFPLLSLAQPDMAPVNDLPNPYQTIEGWAKMPQGRSWGSTSAVDIDPDGVSIWVGERCGGNVGPCALGELDSIFKFDANGNMVTSFGRGMVMWPHGIHVDFQGNVWVTDGRDNRAADGTAPAELKGHQVLKFSPAGELLMAIGEPGGARSPGYLFQPNDVFVAPNGNIFIGEGHSGAEGSTARILKFNSNGEFLKEWGSLGSGPDQFSQPHSLAMDSQGRLFVADRGNNRIQIFDQEGTLLDSWYQFSRNSGVYIDANDIIYAADSESGSVNPAHGAWLRGIRIGNARTGEVTGFIPDPNPDCTGTCTAEGVVADRNGVIYGAEVGPVGGIKRYVRQ
ncbi:MAG: peptidyl-alpha-hydroxyglycine alpha-amidating lyase family protein [Gammaproteobacteria bacterium]|nr:peptidyl-alpha-hydroxyglycine alpha-amidating lyase family protein [Gammaproteobacteria bacterium]MDP2140912.1 peptidyl-alpha-hydroxyglycine alpha-amidating lyase family protein [Gammaproteobacteria bacterium]MDP2349344.1 peptidyl-alpha-hydroxyglycine alpha-amidating lyase family protein [Gammaproteobacteria bacterium]